MIDKNPIYDIHGFKSKNSSWLSPAPLPHDPNFEDLMSNLMLENAHHMGRAGCHLNTKHLQNWLGRWLMTSLVIRWCPCRLSILATPSKFQNPTKSPTMTQCCPWNWPPQPRSRQASWKALQLLPTWPQDWRSKAENKQLDQLVKLLVVWRMSSEIPDYMLSPMGPTMMTRLSHDDSLPKRNISCQSSLIWKGFKARNSVFKDGLFAETWKSPPLRD